MEDDRTHKSFGVAMQFRCIRCHSIRRDVVSPTTGELLYRSYSKPDDYATHDSLDRSDWRMLLLRQRAMNRSKANHPSKTAPKRAKLEVVS